MFGVRPRPNAEHLWRALVGPIGWDVPLTRSHDERGQARLAQWSVIAKRWVLR